MPSPREALFVKLLWPLVVSSNRIFYTAGILLQLVYHYYLIICLLFRFFASLTPFWRCFITNGDVVSTALKTLFDTILFHESSQLILPISAIIWVFFKNASVYFLVWLLAYKTTRSGVWVRQVKSSTLWYLLWHLSSHFLLFLDFSNYFLQT